MNDSSLAVQYPFRLGDTEEIRVRLYDRGVSGSEHHILRFDFYPLISPTHPKRHMAYFDVPLEWIRGSDLRITMRHGVLSMYDNGTVREFHPTWNGGLPLSGYVRLTTSLELRESSHARQLAACVSHPLVIVTQQPIALEWVQMSVTQYCNLSCPMCPRQSGLGFQQAHVPPDVVKAVLDVAPTLGYIGLQGVGEPLLHPDLPNMVRAFRRRLPSHGCIAVTTNGTLLTRDLAARLFEAGLNTVTFSIDGASQAVYGVRRKGGDFDRLCENVAAATALARSTGRKDLWLGTNFVMASDNLAEVPEFMRLAARLGLNKVCFFRERSYPLMDIVDMDAFTLAQVTDDAIALGRELGVPVSFAKPRSGSLPECPFMCGVYLWLNGEVAPCHRMEPPGKPWPTKLFGDVRKRPLYEIWDDPDFHAFRKAVIEGNRPAECRDCTFPDSVVC